MYQYSIGFSNNKNPHTTNPLAPPKKKGQKKPPNTKKPNKQKPTLREENKQQNPNQPMKPLAE